MKLFLSFLKDVCRRSSLKMGFFQKLRLLSWKYYRYRKFYWGWTIAEFFLPIIILHLTISISDSYIGSRAVYQPPYTPAPITERELMYKLNYDIIYYTPSTPTINKLMERIRHKYFSLAKRSSYFPDMIPIANHTILADTLANSTNVSSVGIYFMSYDVHNSFIYSIMSTTDGNTSTLYVATEDSLNGPYYYDPYMDSGFASLQYILESALIDISYGTVPNPVVNVTFEPFPYPRYLATHHLKFMIPNVVSFAIVLSSLVIYTSLTYIIMREKNSGLGEILATTGMSETLNLFGWFWHTFLFVSVVYSIIAFMLIYDRNGREFATIRAVQFPVLWAIIILYVFSQTAFCFVFVAAFDSILLGTTTLIVVSISMAAGAKKVHQYGNFILIYGSCACPIGAFIQGFERIRYYEILEAPVSWNYVFSKELSATETPLGFVFMMLFFDSILLIFIAWYLSRVKPGRVGHSRPLFSFKKKGSRVISDGLRIHESEETIQEENPFKEPLAPDASIGLLLQNLCKNFGSIEAVKNISLSICQNEIFVILGSDKSGKSTILSLIAGILAPSSGSILYKGKVDFQRDFEEYQGLLGFCPQDDRLFPYFSIIDHMHFYGKLKCKDYMEEQAIQYLDWMGLYENSDDLITDISAEMRKKLSISVALMGNSEILVIDEPTSGLDSTSKRKIWALLNELKTGRTIIISTPSPHEAAIIGDRIAIMNSGIAVCEGSPEFLNTTFATGYEVTVKKKVPGLVLAEKDKDPTLKLTNIMETGITGTKTVISSHTEMVFSVPDRPSLFPAHFKILESNKSALNIGEIGVTRLTLEKVFLKIGGDSIYDADGRPLKLNEIVEEAFKTNIIAEKKLRGFSLILQQHRALFNKKRIFLYRRFVLFCMRGLLPTAGMVILLYGLVPYEFKDPMLLLNVQTYSLDVIMLDNTSIVHQPYRNAFLEFLNLERIGYKLVEGHILQESRHLNEFCKYSGRGLLHIARDNPAAFRRETLVGVVLQKVQNSSTLVKPTFAYNRFATHSLPIAINLLSNAILRFRGGGEDSNVVIKAHIEPVKVGKQFGTNGGFNPAISAVSPIIVILYLIMVFFTIDLLYFVSNPVFSERMDGFKHVQYLASVSPITYWINAFLFDVFCFTGLIGIRLLVFHVMDLFKFFHVLSDSVVVILIFFLFIMSGTVFMYLLSFFLTTEYRAYLSFTAFNVLCSLFSGFFLYFQDSLYGYNTPTFKFILLTLAKYVILLIAPLNFCLSFLKFLAHWREKRLPSIFEPITLNSPPHITIKDHLSFSSVDNPYGLLEEMIFLFVDTFIYLLIICILDYGYVYRYIKLKIMPPKLSDVKEEDVPPEIQTERDAVKKLVADSSGRSKVYLIVDQLKKVYDFFPGAKPIVQNITFFVRSGECFGIVGPKKSGKTTTFKMLVGEIAPTFGDSWILDAKLSSKRTEYFSNAGYCAQKDSFSEQLTGREILTLVASLRGISPKVRQDTIERWVTILGLHNVISNKCATYDEGNKRKICAASALIGNPEVVLLDEPTSRIDPVARRALYQAFSQIKSEGRAILISFHSMQECENLCDRFTIFIGGEMKFIGSPYEMARKYAEGFFILVIVKVAEAADTDDSRIDDILQLNYAIQNKFKNKKLTLLIKSKSFVKYEVGRRLEWSDAFKRMEELKESMSFIDSYQISDKSLEDVFQSIVKKGSPV